MLRTALALSTVLGAVAATAPAAADQGQDPQVRSDETTQPGPREVATANLTAAEPPPPPPRHRRAFFELHTGATAPAFDGEFRGNFGPSLVAGLWAGAYYDPPTERRFGWEAGADFTLFDYTRMNDADVYRLRLVGGGRMEQPLAGDLRLFGRVVGGLDFIVASVPATTVGTTVKEEASSLGPVLVPSAGILWQSGTLLVGAIASLPVSYHHDSKLSDRTADFDYLGVELDLLLMVGASL